jgi:alkylation response protein AidB-like acyl-CoA dehydrogenase
MDFDDAPEDAAFRAELREWLAANHPGAAPEDPDAAFAFRVSWQRALAGAGFAAPTWPRAFGGRDASVAQAIIFQEELAHAKVPAVINAMGVWNIAPALLEHSTPAQHQRYLPPMLSAEEIWCQGFSEPGAGSDLAAVSTFAQRDGSDYVINGQKVWISLGHRADLCLLLCRTDASAAKHKGLSMVVLDMHADGVEARPLREITGDASFAEVFLRDVRVPISDRVGEENDGWRVAMSTLTHERVGTITYGILLRHKLDALLAHPLPQDEVRRRVIQQQIGDLWTRIQLIRLTAARTLTKTARGEPVSTEVAVGKLLWSLASQDLAETALELVGIDGLRWRGDEEAVDDGRWAWDWVWSRMTTIGAGTTEIQKNILAERALGLPRG